MTGRRREENWFRYGRACFAPDDPDRKVANPAKIPLRDHNLDMVRLDAETKLIMHAVKDWQIPGTVDTSR